MLLELHAVLARFVGPPRRHDVERQATAAADVIDVCRLLRQQRRVVKRRSHRHHQFQTVGHRRQRRRRRPGIKRRRVFAFDVVQVQLGDERQIVADLFAAPRQAADVSPARFHALVRDIAQPAAEDRHPVSVSHLQFASLSRKSTSRANGSKPTTRVASATKFDRQLMS